MPERELLITLRMAKAQAERAAREFHEGERKRIKETGEAQEVFLKRWSSLWRRLQDAKVKGVQDGFKKEEKAAQQTADKILAGAKKLNAAQVALMQRLREVRIKGIQDEARDEEKRLRAVAALRIKLAREAGGAQLRIAKETNRAIEGAARETGRAIEKAAQDTANRLLAIARRENAAQIGLLQQLREARVQAAQANLQSDEDHRAKMKRARTHALIQQIRDTENRIRAEVAADEKGIAEQLDNDKSFSEAKKAARLKALKESIAASLKSVEEAEETEKNAVASGEAAKQSIRTVNRLKREAEEKDSLRKFVSNQGFVEERRRKEAERTGETQRREAKKTGEAMDGQNSSVRAVTDAYIKLRAAAMIPRAVFAVFDAVARSSADASHYIADIVSRMEAMRDRAAEILAMTGKPITGAEAAAIARRAAANSVSVESEEAFEKALMAESQEVLTGPNAKFSIEDIQNSRIPAYVGSLGGGPGTQQSAAKVLDAVIRNLPAGATPEQMFGEFADLFESAQRGKGTNEVAARQLAEFVQEYAGPGKMEEDPRKAAALMRVFMTANPQKGGTIGRAMMKGALQLRQDEEKMDELGEYGLSRKAKGVDFVLQSIDAIRKKAKADGATFEDTLYRYYEEIREFQGGTLVDVRRELYDDALKGMQGGAAKANQRIQSYTSGQHGRKLAAASGAEAAKIEAGSRFAELSILGSQVEEDLVTDRSLERRMSAGDAFINEMRQRHLSPDLDRKGYAIYQERGRRIKEMLRERAERGDATAQAFLERIEKENTPLEINFAAPNSNDAIQGEGLNIARESAARKSIPEAERQATLQQRRRRRERFEEGRLANPAALPMMKLMGEPEDADYPSMSPRGLRSVGIGPGGGRASRGPLTPSTEIVNGENFYARRNRAGRLRLSAPGADRRMGVVLPGADGRISRRFRHGYVGNAPNSVVSPVRRRAQGPGNPADLGRVGAGVAYSAGMFAADPAHAAAQAHISQNHEYLAGAYSRMSDTTIDMAARSSAMGQRRNEIAAALKSAMGLVTPPVPPSMPSKPFVFRN